MLLEEILLLVFSSALIIVAPTYIFLREKMVKKPLSKRKHTHKRIIKLTTINFLLNFLAALYFTSLLIIVLQRSHFVLTPLLIGLSLLYLISIWVTFYGNGMYITTIMLEDFTLPELREVTSYKTQFIATRLFHEPISHILIFGGWLTVFLILSIMDMSLQSPTPSSYLPLIVMTGIITGFFFAFAQIANGTAIYQFVTGTIIVGIHTVFLTFYPAEFSLSPITSYFLSLITTFEIVIGIYAGYLVLLKLRNKDVIWDKSGGPGHLKPDEKLIDRIFK
jgi:hypothetical protein